MKIERRRFLKCTGLLGPATIGLRQLLAAQNCPATTSDILGPFYQPEAPFRTRIASPAEPGERLFIKGTVSDCRGPLAGAVIDVWQANAAGCYSINENCGVIPGNPDHFRLRGRIKTNHQGGYQFETIKPAPYGTGSGRFRPSHIHYRISAPGGGREGGVELITQVYFEGQPHNDTDPYSSRPEAKSRTIALVKDSARKALRGRFDIVLPTSGETASSQGYDLFIRRSQEGILFQLPGKHPNRHSLALYSPSGCLIRQWETRGTFIECRTATLERGIYLARLSHGDDVETFHIHV